MITLGGKRLKEFGLVLLRGHEHSILPQTRDKSISISGRHGAYDFGADLGPRLFGLPLLFVRQPTKADLQAKIRAFAAHMVDSSGRPKTLDLIFDYEPGVKYTVRYSGSLPIQRLLELGNFTLPLIAYDPFARADQEQIHEDVITSSPYEQIIEVVGNVQTPPLIVLTNEGEETITNFKITNEYRLE